MNSRATVLGILTLAALAFGTRSALAERPSPNELWQRCDQYGGVYFAPSSNGVYGCWYENLGWGTFCGGWKTEYKNSCVDVSASLRRRRR